MLIKCLDNVRFKFIPKEFWFLAEIIWELYQEQKVIPMVTSAADGIHSNRSLHPEGWAWDFRIWGINNMRLLAQRLTIRLREISPYYDVVYWNTNPKTGKIEHQDHMHIEFDIRRKAKEKP